jgi:choice-of-anchor B domain-containing protein
VALKKDMMKLLVLPLIAVLSMQSFGQTVCVNGMAGEYPCRNMDLMKFMTLQECGCDPNGNTNDVWGWVSPASGKEFAILGCAELTSFIDVTDPVNPILVGTLPTHSVGSLWRDVESRGNWLYVVSEAQGHGMQIFDLTQLDGVASPPVVFAETAHYDFFSNCHTVNVDPVSGYVYAYGTDSYNGGEHIVNVSDPLNPVLAGGYDASGYTHDGFAWTYDGPDPDYVGREIVIACNGRGNSENDKLVIVDVTNKTDCTPIGEYNYNGQATIGYFHQGWITKNKKFFLMNDELDEMALGNNQEPYGTRTHIFNITNLDNVTYQGFYESTSPAIDHNLYTLDQFVYESNYRSGVRVLDAIRVGSSILSEVAFFDLYPENDNAQFSGTWSNYPYLPSGLVLATSMYDGFFIMKPTIITTSQDSWDLCSTDDVVFEIDINAELAFPLTVGLNGLGGATASAAVINNQGVATVTITGVSTLSPGNYTPNLLLISNFGEQYEIPLEVNVCTTIDVSESVSSQVSVFPNPAQDELQIQLVNQVETIELFDALGKRVMSIATNNQLSLKVDVRSLAEGAYTLKAGDEAVRVVVAK